MELLDRDGFAANGKKAVLAAMKKRASALLDADHGTGRVWGAGDWVVAEVSATRTTRGRKVSPNEEVHLFRFADGSSAVSRHRPLSTCIDERSVVSWCLSGHSPRRHAPEAVHDSFDDFLLAFALLMILQTAPSEQERADHRQR